MKLEKGAINQSMQKSSPTTVTAASSCVKLSDSTRRKTDLENKKMELAFKLYKLDQEADSFQEKRYLNIKSLC